VRIACWIWVDSYDRRNRLAVAAINLWNIVYLGRAVDHLRSQDEVIDDTVLAHIARLGEEHITFNGD
jgi:hypothetical protein